MDNPTPVKVVRTFSPEVTDAIIFEEGIKPEFIPSLAEQYVRDSRFIPGAPPIEVLQTKHVAAIVGTPSFLLSVDENWEQYLARINENEQFMNDANNPFLPNWLGKTDDKPSLWRRDSGIEIDSMNQKSINEIFYLLQRPLFRRATEVLAPAPCSDPMIMYSIVNAARQFTKILLNPQGSDMGDSSAYRWCTTIPMLVSLGFDSFRQLATHIAMHSDEEDFQSYRYITDSELAALAQNSSILSGYPINIGHADAYDMMQILERCPITRAPSWLPSLILLHVLKHTRFYQDLNGKPFLFAAYRSRKGFIPLDPEGLNQPLCAPANRTALGTLTHILRMGMGSKKKTVCEIAVAGVLNNINPCQITRPIKPYKRPDIIIAPGVVMMDSIPNQHMKKTMWIDPGIGVHHVGIFNSKTGDISRFRSIDNELSVSLEWPLSKATPDDLNKWLSELPPRVEPALPSSYVFAWVRNVNPLDHPRGLVHLYDALMVTNFIREQLSGTFIGSMLEKEYPALWALPMGSLREETTDQGKTSFCRLSAKVLVPYITETQCGATTSPPAMRSAASQIERFGTAIYDEFVPPKSPEHFLHTFGFTTLCTGGMVNPGRAMENAEGLRLKYSLFLAAKTGPELDDVKNRSVFIFMDQLTPENRCTDDELNLIASSVASTAIRLSLLQWLNKNNFIEKVRALKPVQGLWRFPAHAAVIKLLAGDEYPEVAEYIKASWEMCSVQSQNVVESCLRGDMGLKENFYPEWYFQNCSESTLEALVMVSKQKGAIQMLDAIRVLIEDDGNANRNFGVEIGKYGIQESTATMLFSRAFKDNKSFVRGKFTMRKDQVKTKRRVWTAAAIFEKDDTK